MLINGANLDILFTNFNASFSRGLAAAQPKWMEVAQQVNSTTGEEKYGFLGNHSSIRPWMGDRVVHELSATDWAIKNIDFEHTIAVSRNDIEDDRFSVYSAPIEQLGTDAALHPDELVYGLLAQGFTEPAYDGQAFFDTDHPVVDANEAEISVANTDATPGSGPAWFLIDSSRAFKPLIYQQRKPFHFQRKDQEGDENVFHRNEFLYGLHGRSNVGFAFWQLAWGSKQELNADNYAAARAAMMKFTRDGGTKLGITPNVLVVGPDLEQKARKLLMGSDVVQEPAPDFFLAVHSAEWKDSARLVVSPFL